MDQTRSQTNLHGKKIDELLVKMDPLMEAISTNGKKSFPNMESPSFFQQGYMEGKNTRENGESSFEFPRFQIGVPTLSIQMFKSVASKWNFQGLKGRTSQVGCIKLISFSVILQTNIR
jgi:hypothetical protein